MSVPPKNLAVFTRQLSVMIDAGLPLVQCLEILGRQETHAGFAATIRTVRRDVEAGAALATAMKKHPGVFDALYSSLIAAGEAGGILDTILKRLAVYIEQNVKLRRDVRVAHLFTPSPSWWSRSWSSRRFFGKSFRPSPICSRGLVPSSPGQHAW